MQQKDIVKIVTEVKDHILTESYGRNPAYKWLQDTWTTNDIVSALHENNITSKDEAIQYLLDMAHLFGKDR